MDFGASDIVERDTGNRAPEPPKPKPAKPFTKKWTSRRRPVVLDPTAPKVGPQAGPQAAKAAAVPNASGAGGAVAGEAPLSDSERIHLENIRKIQKMSPSEIEQEREEIFRSMDPAVLESLLKRAEKKETEKKPSAGALNEPTAPVVGPRAPPRGTAAEWDPSPVEHKGVHFAQPEPQPVAPAGPAQPAQPVEPALQPGAPGTADQETAAQETSVPVSGVHFASPPEDLRRFFPDLPVETEKLAWMLPIGDDEEAEYSTQLVSVAPSELRFDFHGDLVTPRRSREIPTNAGLHHHGDAPSAAGYTLPELAHLSRSAHPAQRAMAIQTVGRVLHKLRKRKFARSSELQEGLDALVKQTRILDTLAEAADDRTRSLTVRTRAIEALWLAHAAN